MYRKDYREPYSIEEEEAKATAKMVGLAAIKYGDLSNQAAKDYVFDVDRFTSFEGNTGPYILYTIVRIKSILNKYKESGKSMDDMHRSLRLQAESEKSSDAGSCRSFNSVMENAYEETCTAQDLCIYL